MRTLVVFLLLASVAQAQPNAGSVAGHVYLADDQRPMRFAYVELVPLPPPPDSSTANRPKLPTYGAKTAGDGGFLAAHMAPGDYYVSVIYPDYLTPEYEFSAEELLHPTAEVRRRLVEALPTVTVAAGVSSSVSVSLRRGAAISGTLRYEDGAAVPNVEVVPLRRSPAGLWEERPRGDDGRDTFDHAVSDGLGHFRVEGLKAGEYTLKVFRPTDQTLASAVYYGDVFFEKDAKSIHLTDGGEESGGDITIRLSKLHSISGSLASLSGQPINSGHIGLFTVPGNTRIGNVDVNGVDSTFRLDLVPEGHYTLRVTQAQQVNVRGVRDEEDPRDVQEISRSVLQSYADYELPVEVLSDIANLTVSLPAKPK
jgi:hypothetical protein